MYTILVPKSASILVKIFVEILYWKQQLSSKKKKCLSSFYKYLSTIAIEWQIRSKSVELNEPKSRCGSNRPRTFHLKSLKICTCFLHVPPPVGRRSDLSHVWTTKKFGHCFTCTTIISRGRIIITVVVLVKHVHVVLAELQIEFEFLILETRFVQKKKIFKIILISSHIERRYTKK